MQPLLSNRRWCIQSKRVVNRCYLMYLSVVRLCRFLLQTQISGKATTNTNILQAFTVPTTPKTRRRIENREKEMKNQFPNVNYMLQIDVYMCRIPALSYISHIRTNAINISVDINDIQPYAICNGDIDIFSSIVISTAKYDSAISNTLVKISINCTIERMLCK